MSLCEYGCEQEAKYQLKNGKFCCSSSSNGCLKVKERKKKSYLIINKDQICSYGCNRKANYILSNGKFCCENYYRHCPQFRLELSESQKGDKNSFKGHTRERKQIWKEQRKGKNNPMFGKVHSIESKKKIGIKSKEKIYTSEYRQKLRIGSTGRKQPKEQREKSRQRMLNGHAIKMLKAIKKISKPEIELRNIIKELYPNCEFQHGVFNYAIDVAIPEYKIAIEYDGYFHFNNLENKKYHENRQKRIEKEGWKFLRYNIFQKFPSKEQVEKDIISVRRDGELVEI